MDLNDPIRICEEPMTDMHALQEEYQAKIQLLADASNRMAQMGYVTSCGGNISCRADDNVVLITPTKMYKGDIRFADICIVDFAGHVLFAGKGRKPTGEMPFHLRILTRRPDIRSVAHAHPKALTALALAHSDLLTRPLVPEVATEIGPLLPVAYAEPLSEDLAQAFDAVLERSDAFLMHNHGVLVCAREDPQQCLRLLDMLESTAVSAIMAASLGKVHEISREECEKLDNILKTRNLPCPGATGRMRSIVDLYY